MKILAILFMIIFNRGNLPVDFMSFESSPSKLLTVGNHNIENQDQISLQQPVSLNGMLQNRELLTCYKCKEIFDPEKQDADHTLDSNNILLGIILNKKTPSSICLKCLSLKMMEVITEQFTKNSKDYTGLFFNYEQKFKS
jgi:hypothetical protein